MTYLISDRLDLLAFISPHSPAVIDPGGTVTWDTLARSSNQIANHLRARVPAQSRVALLADRRAASYAAILGIWRSGCVYVPIDCEQPEERLLGVLRAASPAAAILAPERAGLAPAVERAAPGVAIVRLRAELAPGGSALEGERPSDAAPPALAVDEDLAYVFFTSGSTGTPKGVMVAHRSLLAYGRWVADQAELTAADRVLAHTPLHFDVSLYTLAGALCSGAALVTVPRALEGNAQAVCSIAREHGLTAWISAPYLLTLFTSALRLEEVDLPRLRVVSYVGEVLPNATLIAWMRRFPQVVFHNLYGPTEATVTCTGHRYERVPGLSDPVPIGKPHPNCRVLLLAEDGATIEKEGVAGEIYVHGGCVARGYLGEPELTSRAFVDLGERSGFRPAYRTGDLAYRDGNGDLVFVGRRDHQVKIRGYRVELGEIEAALQAHPAVRNASVVAVAGGERGELVLVAFVDLASGVAAGEPALRGHVASRLPRYMVPSRVLEGELPRGPSGKVDRRALEAEARAVVSRGL